MFLPKAKLRRPKNEQKYPVKTYSFKSFEGANECSKSAMRKYSDVKSAQVFKEKKVWKVRVKGGAK